MSRLRVGSFRHPDATADAITLTNGGDTQINRALGLGGATYGSSGDVLTSAGSGAVPTWTTPTSLSNAEDGTGTDFEFNSGFGSNATAYGVRAFTVFDGASPGSPDITRNVSTIGDTAAGRFTINFTNNMPDIHYAMAGSAGNHGTTQAMRGIMPDATFTTSAAAIRVVHTDTTVADDDYIAVMFVR